jgi:hypothetical protein
VVLTGLRSGRNSKNKRLTDFGFGEAFLIRTARKWESRRSMESREVRRPKKKIRV